MRAERVAFAAYVTALTLFLVSAVVLDNGLPDRVATHFDFSGQPTGYMGRDTHTVMISLLGLCLSGAITAVAYSLRHRPGVLNVPRQDYWNTPQHFPRAARLVLALTLWFNVITLAWLAAINALVALANRSEPAQLDTALAALFSACYVLGILAWIVLVYVTFQRAHDLPFPAETNAA